MDLNRVTLIGRLARPPVTKSGPLAAKTSTTFRLATSTRAAMKTGRIVDTVEFHDVLAWGKLAEVIGQYVKQGSKVYVEGRLRSRSDRAHRGRHVLVEADNLIMLGHRQRGVV